MRIIRKLLAILGIIAYLIAILLLARIGRAVVTNEIRARQAAAQTETSQAMWPTPDKTRMLQAARDYNTQLTGGTTIGFDGNGTDGGRLDTQYMNVMNDGDGIIATLSIPSISFNQPIYHTTDSDALASGVGHVYGTALPVGDKGTHSALASHSGSGDRIDFTRIRELKTGSFFYITVLGKQMGYRVDRITVVDPDDFNAVTDTNPDEARVTLVTCTPLGVNTRRLLVSGVREDIPDPIPDASTQHDSTLLIVGFSAAGITVLYVVRLIVRHRRRVLSLRK
ncbi:class C sortase [Bifidobacterium sp. SO1]|uniref:class C sortase n=1 Tax=Bifidobacterium sp. SO1 TaxID=2809029 RepID=UPI001BDC52D4|nr:class C sortase [Bifidobacterium sp. SO1]